MGLFVALLPAAAAEAARPYLAEPAIAPNRAEIAFASGGDIWTAPLAGGEAHLLLSHAATESRPLYSPEGDRLAFVSTRTGGGDIYVLQLGTGALKRITYSDGAEQLDAWSRDGKYLYFSSTGQDIAGMNDVFRVSAGGGTPMPVTADRYVNEFFAAPSPAADMVAFTARGLSASQWWRKGHSHIDESEIWLATLGAPAKYQMLEGGAFKCAWPMWSADGSRLYFVSDQGGAENVWEKPARGGNARKVTSFQDGRVLWPSISFDGKTIVFERDFGIWKLDLPSGRALAVEITLRGAPAAQSVSHLTLTEQFRGLAVSPDARKVAFLAHGEVFAASAKDGGQAARVTRTPASEAQIAWAPDNRRMVYVSGRDGSARLYLYDFGSGAETRITDDAAGDSSPTWSRDGKMVSFFRGGNRLCVYDTATQQVRVLAKGRFGKPPFDSARSYAWSPDSRWIAYADSADRSFRNLYVVPAAGGEPRQVSYLANTGGDSVLWSPDGAYLLFDTSQRTENSHVVRVDLVPRVPPFREDRFRDLFQEPRGQENRTEQRTGSANPAPPKPVDIAFDGIRNRLTFLPIGLDARLEAISNDGKTLLIRATAARQQNLYTFPLDELATEPPVARQVTSTAGAKDDAQFSADGKEVYFLEQGRIRAVTLENRQVRTVAATAEMDVDFEIEKREVLREAWTFLDQNFYDEKFHGVDWKALRERYAARVEGARTSDELRRMISLMLGELNASHMGISAPATPPGPGTTGRLGLRFDAVEYESAGRLRITDVVPLSPAGIAGQVRSGDYLVAIDGMQISRDINLDSLLEHKVNRRVLLTVASQPDGSGKREVPVRPIGLAAEKDLLYRQWVEAQRAYTFQVSGGRLGYVHIRDMSAAALDQLYLDLDSENHRREGVLVDVRNNNGGFVNAYALDVLTRQSYLKMATRDEPEAPARIVLGQRALERPTILLVNRHSLSDAEDFTEGYRALKLGKVVGEPTAGWIIYTSQATLIDGSVLRLPHTRVTTAEGVTMEMSPRPVDVAVDKPVGGFAQQHDQQIDRAVRELLADIDGKKAGPARR